MINFFWSAAVIANIVEEIGSRDEIVISSL